MVNTEVGQKMKLKRNSFKTVLKLFRLRQNKKLRP